MNLFFPKTKRIPKELRELQKPWLKGADPIVERWVRTMTRPEIHEYSSMLIVSGRDSRGAGKIGRVDARLRELFDDAAETEYFGPDQSPKALAKLQDFLASRGVSLDVFAPEGAPGEAFKAALGIFDMLPPHHFGHPGFTALKVGHSPEKPLFTESSYWRDGAISFCDTLVLGAKRNFRALALHEVGHALQAIVEMHDREELLRLSKTINPKFGVDYLAGKDARIVLQSTFDGEFLAEAYLHYVTQGQALRVFIAEQEPKQRAAWGKLMDIYKKYFDGIQYG